MEGKKHANINEKIQKLKSGNEERTEYNKSRRRRNFL